MQDQSYDFWTCAIFSMIYTIYNFIFFPIKWLVDYCHMTVLTFCYNPNYTKKKTRKFIDLPILKIGFYDIILDLARATLTPLYYDQNILLLFAWRECK